MSDPEGPVPSYLRYYNNTIDDDLGNEFRV